MESELYWRIGVALAKVFAAHGHEVAPRDQQSPEGLMAVYKADLDKWTPIIKAANIKLQ